ncbi:hypothetical protein SAZ_42500 [Streptomyces noursei ZPM]|nr:hypothetical protein SAZ_00305 [Streptomyces noursei ZPM]AKA09309.1 hypothetical protein SAZ_42500 [Streptomyces noursei ZPM]EOS98368.1 hypothetical protein K530_39306 [Streptomyces noursei CCRC 11814]EXU92467.1 hypothetical protein P354_21365 [Streptomyces noursei PD-1]
MALGHGAVVAAFSALSAIWAEVLGRSCPGTVSWQVLGHTVSAVRSASVCPSIDVDALYEVLPVLQADAVLLRDRLGMSLSGAADLMGVDESALVVLQRLADRSLDEA